MGVGGGVGLWSIPAWLCSLLSSVFPLRLSSPSRLSRTAVRRWPGDPSTRRLHASHNVNNVHYNCDCVTVFLLENRRHSCFAFYGGDILSVIDFGCRIRRSMAGKWQKRDGWGVKPSWVFPPWFTEQRTLVYHYTQMLITSFSINIEIMIIYHDNNGHVYIFIARSHLHFCHKHVVLHFPL